MAPPAQTAHPPASSPVAPPGPTSPPAPPWHVPRALLSQPQVGLWIAWERRLLGAPAIGAPIAATPDPLDRRLQPIAIAGSLPQWPRTARAMRRWLASLGWQLVGEAPHQGQCWVIGAPSLLTPVRLAPWIREGRMLPVADLLLHLTQAVAAGDTRWVELAPRPEPEAREEPPR